MSRGKPATYGDAQISPMSSPNSWSRTHGTYIAGRAYLDGADETAAEMEAKWGCDRLRLLVSPELREKFDRQRYLLNQAIWHGDLEGVRREANRMVTAWTVLDRAATAAGKQPLDPQVWEVTLGEADAGDGGPTGDGKAIVAAIVPDHDHARAVQADGRHVVVFTLEEIGRLLTEHRMVARAKVVWPGATVTTVRRSVDDPLNAIDDTSRPLDDEIGF